MGLGRAEGERMGKRETGEVVEWVGRLVDMTLIEAAGRKVGSVVWYAWGIS